MRKANSPISLTSCETASSGCFRLHPFDGTTKVDVRPTPDRVVLSGILYRLRTGCQWEAIPKEFGSGSTCVDDSGNGSRLTCWS